MQKKCITLFYVKYADLLGNAALILQCMSDRPVAITLKYQQTQPYADLSILIQFSFSRVFSYRHGQMRQFVVRFVPEKTIRFSPAQ